MLIVFIVYHQQLYQRQLQLQQLKQQERLMSKNSANTSSSHAARDYDIKRKLSAKQRDRREENNNNNNKPAPSQLTGQPGTVKQRVKEKKHAMKDSEVIAKLKTICIEADPTLVYKNMKKIGQG